jgi:hypothetical protein
MVYQSTFNHQIISFMKSLHRLPLLGFFLLVLQILVMHKTPPFVPAIGAIL